MLAPSFLLGNCITRVDLGLRSPKNRSLLDANEDFKGE